MFILGIVGSLGIDFCFETLDVLLLSMFVEDSPLGE